MKNIIPAALSAAMMATPARACTDWKAVAAFDAVIVADDRAELNMADKILDSIVASGGKPTPDQTKTTDAVNRIEATDLVAARDDRAAAIADKCQEEPQ